MKLFSEDRLASAFADVDLLIHSGASYGAKGGFDRGGVGVLDWSIMARATLGTSPAENAQPATGHFWISRGDLEAQRSRSSRV